MRRFHATLATLFLCLTGCAASAARPAGSPDPLDADVDHDGLNDAREQDWLNRFRPWVYCDHSEPLSPCSATWFVQHSDLIGVGDEVKQPELSKNPRLVFERGAR